jgi:hypothetical protein
MSELIIKIPKKPTFLEAFIWDEIAKKWNKFNLVGKIFVFPVWFILTRIPRIIFWSAIWIIAVGSAYIIVGIWSVIDRVVKSYKKVFYEKSVRDTKEAGSEGEAL